MPYRLELLWKLIHRLDTTRKESREEELDETLKLLERELSLLEKGLVDLRDPNSHAFLIAVLDELNPVIAALWAKLPNDYRNRLQAIRMRALDLRLQNREGCDYCRLEELNYEHFVPTGTEPHVR